jgi:hypothetical protein
MASGEVVTTRSVRIEFLLVMCCGSALAFTGCGSKPTYTSGGRSASYWAEVLTQPDVEMRRKAVAKLGPMMLTDEVAFPATLAALRDQDAQVRLAAIRSLRIYGVQKASQAVPALREVQEKDKEPPVREAAAKAVTVLTAQ